MDDNPQGSTSREDLLNQINVFEINLKKYRELMSQDKDMFKTIKNNPEDFLQQVTWLGISATEINVKLNDSDSNKDIEIGQHEHYKVMFKHYISYFDIQKKTANTFLQLENRKKTNLSTISNMRNKYIINDSTIENPPKR